MAFRSRTFWCLTVLSLGALLCTPQSSAAAGTGYPDGVSFNCDWEFRSGSNAGLEGKAAIRLDLQAGALRRTGELQTTYPDGSSRNDSAVLDTSRIGDKEKLWRINLPDANISCTMHVQKSVLIFDSCSNGLYQICRQQGTSTQGTGQRDLYYFLEEITIFKDHENFSKPEIELYRSEVLPCGACPCGPGELFCQRPNSTTTLVFDGGQHKDATGRTVTLPDINNKGKVYRPNIAIAPFGYHVKQYIVFLVEDDKAKGELRINDCIKLLECNTTIEVSGGSGFPLGVKDCPSGTVARAISCALGTGDDQFSNPIHLDVSINPGQSHTVTSRDWRIKFRLDFL